MRIAYFLHTASATDGSSKAFIHLMDKIISMGVCPLVILPKNGDINFLLEKRNINYIVLHWAVRPSVYPWSQTFKDKLLFVPRLLGRLFINTFATLHSIWIVHKFRPQIIHSNTSVLAIGYYTASFLNIPHIWHIREYGAINFSTFYYYPTLKHQLRRYRRDHSYTICVTKDLQKYNNLYNHANSCIIYDGVLPLNATCYDKQKESYFLYVGRLENTKGIIPLIHAYAMYCKMHSNPLALHIVGNGSSEYTQLVKNTILYYDITDKVKLLGTQKNVSSIYKKAKAVIVPSLSEGFGFVTAEAMFLGCLVVGHNTTGTKEQFDNGKEITEEEIALRYSTQEQLVQHLIDITNNNIKHYEPKILRAQQVVSQLYSIESHAKKIYNYYTEILNKQKLIK